MATGLFDNGSGKNHDPLVGKALPFLGPVHEREGAGASADPPSLSRMGPFSRGKEWG
jgi:hypothetical protein